MRILTLDIETSPHEAYAFQVWQANIAAGQIKKPTEMLTWTAKFLDKKKSVFRDWNAPDFLTKLHEMLDDADIVVGYNQQKFDIRHINREFVQAGLSPTRPMPQIDMLRVVKQQFLFPHNRLDYVCGILLNETKLETGGFDLWPAFLRGDKKAEAVMRKYNIRDVVLTEKLYLHLRAWVKNHPNVGIFDVRFFDEPKDYTCEACGSHNVELKRPRRTRCFAIRVVRCECGHYQDGARKKLS